MRVSSEGVLIFDQSLSNRELNEVNKWTLWYSAYREFILYNNSRKLGVNFIQIIFPNLPSKEPPNDITNNGYQMKISKLQFLKELHIV